MPGAASRDHATSSFLVLRTPLLPFETFAALGEGLAATQADAELGERLAQEEARVVARMRALVERPEIREALFLASPSFERALSGWMADPDKPGGADVPLTLIRYLARMAARPTPFGLFAGCSLVRTGSEGTRLVLAPLSRYRKHTRLDTGYLSLVAEGFEQDASLREALRFRPSSGLYEAAGKIRYAEGVTKPDSRERSYQLVAVERTTHLEATLARAGGGASATELVEALVADDPEIERDDATAYVESLISNRILCSDATPSVTGAEPLVGLIEALRAAGTPARQAANALEAARTSLRALDEAPLGLAPERYQAVASGLEALPAKIDMARLFQVDLHKPASESMLGAAASRRIQEAVELTTRLATPFPDEAMRRFREAFAERYGEPTDGPLATRRMVPLCEALDDEAGLGFGTAFASGRSPLLEGLAFATDAGPAKMEFGRREERLLRGLVETLRAGRVEWTLSDADLEALAASAPATLPDAFAFWGTLAARSAEALARGDLQVLVDFLVGPSGAVFLGRFCHGDPDLHRAVEAHLRAEEALQPDAVFAEIVHLPEGRLGNILARPTLRAYEIPYLGRSGAPEERQIPITDLYLILDENRMVLFSKRLGREVIPRLTSAHNFAASRLAIYRFLCGLQRERNRHAFAWNWGPLAGSAFLPRVSRGNVVLSLARWTIGKEDLAPLAEATHVGRFRLVQELRQRHHFPRWLVLAEGDRTLPVDLDNPVCVASLAALVARRDAALLTEMFPAPGELVAEGPEGRFAHQVIVPFVRTPAPRAPATPAATSTATKPSAAHRTFAPGSEWLFVKLYAGPASADAILTDFVAPAVARARRAKSLSRWFFFRHGDPHWHVALALRGEPARLARMLPRLNAAAAPLLADGRLWRTVVDTYQREVERYGGESGVELAESVFEADSDAALAILERLELESGADERWRLALRGCHELLVDLGFEPAERTEVIQRARATLGAELCVDKVLERRIGARFRGERAALEELLVAQASGDHALAPGLVALAQRSARVRSIAEELRARQRAGRLTVPVRDLAVGLLRTSCNRLFQFDLRAQELVVYDFLQRLYVSEAARGRSPAPAAGVGAA